MIESADTAAAAGAGRIDRVLVLDPEPESLARIAAEIGAIPGVEVTPSSRTADGIEIARRGGLALMILDVKAGGGEGTAIENLKRFREACPSAGLLVLTTYADTDDLYRVFQVDGVQKYLLKPWKEAYRAAVEEVLAAWREARAREEERARLEAEKERLARENRELRRRARERHPWDRIVAASPRMGEALLRSKGLAASPDRNVVLFGESGTGKRLLGRLIHYHGERGAAPLLEVHGGIFRGGAKGGIDPDLGPGGDAAEGSTWAEELLAAKWEVARGGTLLVGQLDELPARLQDLLAGWLTAGPAGHPAAPPLPEPDPRVIATASDLPDVMVMDGRLAASLQRALDAIVIEIPPLRERPDDLADLALLLARGFAERVGKEVQGLGDNALALLSEHGFPGNVAELETILERAVASTEGPFIEFGDLKIP